MGGAAALAGIAGGIHPIGASVARAQAVVGRMALPAGVDPADWLPTVPPGTVVDFPADRVVPTRGIEVTDLDGITVNGNGATLLQDNDGRQAIFRLNRCHDWTVRDLRLRGTLVDWFNHVPGEVDGLESAHGFVVRGGARCTFTNVLVWGVWGDALYLGRYEEAGEQYHATDIVVDGLVGIGMGRHFVCVVSAKRCRIERLLATGARRAMVDIEPGSWKDEVDGIIVRHARLGAKRLHMIAMNSGSTNTYGIHNVHLGNWWITNDQERHPDADRMTSYFHGEINTYEGSAARYSNITIRNMNWDENFAQRHWFSEECGVLVSRVDGFTCDGISGRFTGRNDMSAFGFIDCTDVNVGVNDVSCGSGADRLVADIHRRLPDGTKTWHDGPVHFSGNGFVRPWPAQG